MEILTLLSRRVRIVLFLAFGYSPFVPMALSVGDIEWNRNYGNETLAWMLILSIFDILAIIGASKLLQVFPVFAVISILLALVPITWGGLAWIETGLGPSSLDDTHPYGAMLDFWLNGGGFLAGVILLPIAAWYLYLRFKERKIS